MQSLKGLSKSIIVTDKDVKIATRSVPVNAYKHSRGRVLIVANSIEWRGASIMAAQAAKNALAALRTASGFVTVAAPKGLMDALSRDSPVYVLTELSGGLSDYLRKIASVRHEAIILGPGIQPSATNTELLDKIIRLEKRTKRKIIVDAGVIGIIARKKRMISRNMIITPHDGEFRALTGIDVKDKSVETRMRTAKVFAKGYKCVIVLKGHVTIITDGSRLKVNIAKTPALATMGTGDVLCGMIASYAAQHDDNFESAVAAVRVHSIIGDKLFKKKGEHITAQDVIDAIPDALKRFDVIR